MSKKLPCPTCKQTIVIDPETLAGSDSIQCQACGSSFKLKKKNDRPLAPKSVPVTETLDAEVVEPPDSPGAGLDFGSMNFDEFGNAPANVLDPLADPLASPPPLAGGVPAAAYYAPTTVQLPVDKPLKKNMSPKTIIMIVVGSIGGLFLLACGVGGFLFVRGALAASTDERSMQMVALAMMNYESAFKRFPAPAATDAEKKPVLSWTVALLSYAGESAPFATIEANIYGRMLAWDAPGNELLQGKGPSIYRSARGNAKANERNVFVITKPYDKQDYTHWPMFVEGQYARINEVTDGTANTILAIQLTRYAKPWAAPGDLTVDEAYELIQKEPGSFLVVMVDGSRHWLPTSIPPDKFAALTTRAGGEPLQ